MKNTLLALFSLLVILSGCKNANTVHHCSNPPAVDTTQYTDVVIVNNSKMDSVKVWLTLPYNVSVVGKFGIVADSTRSCEPGGSPCIGWFWAKKGIGYHLGTSEPVSSAVICFVDQQEDCHAAIQAGWETGLNIFEFTVNTWCQNDSVTGANESADISLVDGVHSYLRMSVTSQGARSTQPLQPNFGAFWDYGLTNGPDGKGGDLIHFKASKNTWPIQDNANIPGVFPHGCDWCYKQFSPPPTCFPVKCSDKWDINTCQLNRPGQGGELRCEFLGLVPRAAMK